MKKTYLGWGGIVVALLVASLGGAGCQQTGSTTRRAAVVALGTGAGAVAGHELGNGRPAAAAVGAVVGAGVTHLALGRDPAVLQQGFDLGYMQGQSDAIKRQYFLRLSAEKQAPASGKGRVREYVLPGPEELPDGTRLEPHVLRLRVVE